MRKSLLMFGAALLMLAACKPQESDPVAATNGLLVQKATLVNAPQGDPLTKQAVDDIILGYMRDRKDFHWEWLNIDQLTSAAQYSERILSVGYRPADVADVHSIIHEIDIQKGAWKEVHDAIINLVVNEVNRLEGTNVKASDIVVDDDQVLPVIAFKLTNREVITQLYNLANVRYIEPLGYWPDIDAERSSSGCGGSTYAVNAADFSTGSPACRIPWNFNNISVPSAWMKSRGQGITVGVIDAGLSSSQTLLSSAFNNGESNVGRTVTTDFTFGTSAFNTCTHGTSMSGLAVSPKNNMSASVGVAYQSNLHFIRAAQDVVLDASAEQIATKNALVRMGNHASVRIVSISMGSPFSSSNIYDGLVYCYNKGKLIFGAAGTSFSWTSWWGVVYPAAYSQCVAITGVKESSNTCSDCHDGSQVDFTVPMERNVDSNRNSLSLPVSGTNPSYIGGSSAATATAAGVAALVWSAKPTLNRDQVLNCIKTTSQYYPGYSSYTGYGNVNALAAVNAALAQ
jgi:hypothetical protein